LHASEIDVGQEDAVLSKPRIHGQQLSQASGEQECANHQHQR
jgi:hypothetical protein